MEVQMSIRKVSNRGGNIIGRLPSLKVDRMVSFESLLERDFIYWLEFEPTVSWFAEQPLTILYQHGQRTLRYTPDFHVIKENRNFLVECKPVQFVTKAENQRKFVAAQTWCAKQDWRFQVVTEVELNQGYRLHNIKRLHQFARYPLAPGLKTRVLAFLERVSRPVTLADVMQDVAPEQPQRLFIPLLTMAFHHELQLALDEAPLSAQTPVEVAVYSSQGGC
jgi:hypothetical protein